MIKHGCAMKEKKVYDVLRCVQKLPIRKINFIFNTRSKLNNRNINL